MYIKLLLDAEIHVGIKYRQSMTNSFPNKKNPHKLKYLKLSLDAEEFEETEIF